MDDKKVKIDTKKFSHKKVEVTTLPRNNALTEKQVLVFPRKIVGKQNFKANFYEVLAALLGYKEKGAAQVVRYMSENVIEGKMVIITLRKLSKELGVSITWIVRIFDRMTTDGFVESVGQGIWKVSDEFLAITKKPDQRTQFVIDLMEVPEQTELLDEDGSLNIDDLNK